MMTVVSTIPSRRWWPCSFKPNAKSLMRNDSGQKHWVTMRTLTGTERAMRPGLELLSEQCRRSVLEGVADRELIDLLTVLQVLGQ
jgi:hypothetical protein